MQLVQKLAEAKDENGLLSQALQDLQVGNPHYEGSTHDITR